MNLPIAPMLKNVVKFCGINNLFTDVPTDIADCIVSCLPEIPAILKGFFVG